MSSGRLPRASGLFTSPERPVLRPLRNNIGFRVDITPTGVSDMYDFSLGRPQGRDSFVLGAPMEFDLAFVRVFYNSSAARVGTYVSREDILGLPAPEPAPQPIPDGIRHLVLDDDDEVSPTPDPIPAPITPARELITKENHDELVYKYRYLNGLEMQVIFGNTMIWWGNRLGSLDRYCLWDKNPGPTRSTIYMAESEAAILLNTGYFINCSDINRHARKILSHEQVRIRFNPVRPPVVSIGLEVVLEGLLYAQI